MASLEIALLGAPRITCDGKAVKTDRRKAIALLAYLAVTGKSHTRDHLAGLLWPGYERESAYAYLRRTLWELNQVLEKAWLVLEGDHVALQLTQVSLDTADFERLSHALEAEELTRAIALYRGEFMEGFSVADTAPFEEWQLQQTEYFRREFAETLEKLVNVLQQEKDFNVGLDYARRWLAIDLLNETAHCAIMRLLAAMGDRTGAIRQYETCVQALDSELGVTPQLDTTLLYQAILHGTVRAETTTQTGQSSGIAAPAVIHLPVLPTPFIGRRPEVEQIKSLAQDPAHHLIALVGPGGTGKTRLSIQVASEIGNLFPDGIFFIPLAELQTTEAIPSAMAKALGFSFYRDERPIQQILDFLREKHMLIILDNFEHLIEASELVAEILATAPEVKVFVTSRVRLNIQGEQLYTVGGMRMPDEAEASKWDDPLEQTKPYSAIQLFLDRARLVKPDFVLAKENLPHVLKICNLVQGVPLGLELAAAWLELLSPAEVSAEIARSLDFLETNQVDVPDRQRSIRAVFESSWNLLKDDEKMMLQRLCVFAGSFSREAAQEVSGASLRVLLKLVNKSWLQQIQGGRYQLHGLLRHYGLERLKSDVVAWNDAHDRHAAYFTRFIALQSLRMKSKEQNAGKQALEEELLSNIKAAWDWLILKQRWSEIVDPFALGLLQVGYIRAQMVDLLPWIRDARLQVASIVEKEPLNFAIISTLEVYTEESEQIKDFHPADRTISTWQFVSQHQLAEPMGLWFVVLASMVIARNLDPDGENQLNQAVERIRSQNDKWALGIALVFQSNRLGLYGYDEEKLLEAGRLFESLEALNERGIVAELLCRHAIAQKRPLDIVISYDQQAKRFFREAGSEAPSLSSFLNLTDLYFRQGKIEEGFAVHRETQQMLERIGNQRLLVFNSHWEALRAVRFSTFQHALDAQQHSIDLSLKMGVSKADYFWGIYEKGDIYRIFGDPSKAVELYEQALVGFRKLYMVLGVGYYWRALGDIALKGERYEEALEHYNQYLDYAVLDNHVWSMVQANAKRALAFAYLGKTVQARSEILSVLRNAREMGEDELAYHALLAEAACLDQEGQQEKAVELAAFLQNNPVVWNEIKHHAREIIEKIASNLPEPAVQAALQRGRLLELDSVSYAIISKATDQPINFLDLEE